MKENPSAVPKKESEKPPNDKIASEFAEMKARKIPARDLVWLFRFTASSNARLQAALPACVECLTAELGKRARVVLETETVGRVKYQNFILRVPKATTSLLHTLDQNMAECCKRMKVNYYFLGYGEEIYNQDRWKNLGTILDPVTESVADLDCRAIRYDGLYCHKTGDTDGDWLRFYPDGQCTSVCVSEGNVDNLARWFTLNSHWHLGGKRCHAVRGD